MIRKFFFVFLVTLLLCVFGVRSVFAANESHKRVIVLGADQVINTDYFAAGSDVSLLGKVNGDAYIAGGNVNIPGEVNGDLLVAGGNVNVTGKVSQNVRVLGGQVNIASSSIGRNLTVVGGSVNISESTSVVGSLSAAAGSLEIFGKFGKGANFASGNGNLGGQINGDARAAFGHLTLSEQSKIGGDFTYLSDSEAKVMQGAKVEGKTVHNFPKRPTQAEKEDVRRFFLGLHVAFKIISLLSSFIVGLIILKMAPNFVKRVSDNLLENTLKCLGAGLLTVILVPVISLILIVVILGIPIAVIGVLLFLILVYFSKIFVAFTLGKKVLGFLKYKSEILSLGLGLIVFGLIGAIPVIGFVIVILFALGGIGSLIITKASLVSELRSKNLI